MTDYDYDLVVIGGGPAGQAAALQASRLGKNVALLERLPDVGWHHGQCQHSQQDHARIGDEPDGLRPAQDLRRGPINEEEHHHG